MAASSFSSWDGEMAWQDNNEALVPYTHSALERGKYNTDLLLSNGRNHPAAKYCRYLGPDWYLPSSEELYILMLKQYKDPGLASAFITQRESFYWSSTESNVTSSAMSLLCRVTGSSVISAHYYSIDKMLNSKVRCVRNI